MISTVLFVDDELHVLHGLVRNLRKEQFHIRTATSAEEAFAILARDPIDLIVCDWQLPGRSGTDFLARVAEQYPHTTRIMLTGQASLPVVIGAINSGQVTKFLTKPYDAAELAVVIRDALHRKQVSSPATAR
jgi:two-component system probable response regulator PhcQ